MDECPADKKEKPDDKKRKKLLTNGLRFANIIFALERAADVSKETKK